MVKSDFPSLDEKNNENADIELTLTFSIFSCVANHGVHQIIEIKTFCMKKKCLPNVP